MIKTSLPIVEVNGIKLTVETIIEVTSREVEVMTTVLPTSDVDGIALTVSVRITVLPEILEDAAAEKAVLFEKMSNF